MLRTRIPSSRRPNVRPSCAPVSDGLLNVSHPQSEWLEVARKSRGKRTSAKASRESQAKFSTLLPRIEDPAHIVALDPLTLFYPFSLSAQDREYLAFFPHTSLVQWFGKPWKWASLNYLHSKIAPHSVVVMRMVLAIAAAELESIRYAQQTQSSGEPPRQRDHERWVAGTHHYRIALRGFQSLLVKSRPLSEQEFDEILAAFLLMAIYELHFSADTAGLQVHISGIYTFLRVRGVTFQGTWQQGSNLPVLSQQLLLFIMYIHISIIHQGQAVPSLWERAGHESQLPSILDKLFYASRNVHLSIWQSGYPTQELVDDFSVFRPLELFNECNKFKLLIRDQQLQSAVDADKLAMELADIGNRFQDLIALSQRCDSGLCKRELQTIYYVVAEFHAIELMLHQTICTAKNESCHRRSLDAFMRILKKISADDDSKLGRVFWAMIVTAESISDEDHRQWIQDALQRIRNMGVYKSVTLCAMDKSCGGSVSSNLHNNQYIVGSPH
ncbi:uncharacterized protein BHQ10_004541 [Talaromyces amestolkiae]|uniref:Transcription factor domain-containing protein n=1 Tax=Talaromyces amestolkiae TaxID=1196081 RepID=A0A364KYC0_TALAM|nr:uncharacterized protein BHQ10_004541 [Talaromyces amestolkiae]RAO68529.1 hypothetical protein BHQ10_004541 [Talaromyces amestolkiae]